MAQLTITTITLKDDNATAGELADAALKICPGAEKLFSDEQLTTLNQIIDAFKNKEQ